MTLIDCYDISHFALVIRRGKKYGFKHAGGSLLRLVIAVLFRCDLHYDTLITMRSSHVIVPKP